jgi:hypothetical protein
MLPPAGNRPLLKYSDDQPRDDAGRFGSGGGATSSSPTTGKVLGVGHEKLQLAAVKAGYTMHTNQATKKEWAARNFTSDIGGGMISVAPMEGGRFAARVVYDGSPGGFVIGHATDPLDAMEMGNRWADAAPERGTTVADMTGYSGTPPPYMIGEVEVDRPRPVGTADDTVRSDSFRGGSSGTPRFGDSWPLR